MKISAFYENIVPGAEASGIGMRAALERLKKAGMDRIYLMPQSWEKDKELLKEALPALGLEVEGLHSWILFPKNPSDTSYRGVIDLAAELGAEHVLFVPGMLTEGNTRRDINSILAGMRAAVTYGSEKGIHVLMEDFDGLLSPFNSIAGLQYFMDSIPGLGCAFDTGNFVMFREDELEAAAAFAEKIKFIHIKDRAITPLRPGNRKKLCADLSGVYPCTVGSGYIRIREIFEYLASRGITANAVAELYDCDPEYMLEDIEASIRWIKENIPND